MKMRQRGALAEEPYRGVVLQFLNNIVLGSTAKGTESSVFWKVKLTEFILEKFQSCALSGISSKFAWNLF